MRDQMGITHELANLQNMPSDMTPRRGPPSRPNIDRAIWRAVEPIYWQANARPSVITPKMAALTHNITIFIEDSQIKGGFKGNN